MLKRRLFAGLLLLLMVLLVISVALYLQAFSKDRHVAKILDQEQPQEEVKDRTTAQKPKQTKTSRNKGKQPHIIFILADDYGFHDIGYHGSDIRTPNLDRLAYQGVRLENYYVQPICTPTRVQLLSGRYQIHTGLQHGIIWSSMPSGLPLDNPTIADKLREAGYSTHMVGKWHVGFYKKEYTPTYRGFDSFFGFLSGDIRYYTHIQKHANMTGYDMWNNMEPVRNESGHYTTHLFTEKVVNIIRGHKPGSKPLFIYLPYQAVHQPLEVPEPYLNLHPHIHEKHRQIYAGMTAAMDEGVGNITAALKERGLWENTVLIFSTDNGGNIKPNAGSNNWPLKGGKGSLHEGGIRGVGFVSSPLLREEVRGTQNSQLMHVTDWFPTLVHLANGKLEGTKPLDGFNQWNTIQNYQSNPRKEILHSIDPIPYRKGQTLYNDTFDTRISAAIRVGDWKLLTGAQGEMVWKSPHYSNLSDVMSDAPKKKNFFLYNIKEDPSERKDLAETYPDIVRKLLQRLKMYEDTSVPCFYPDLDPRADPKLRDGFWGPWL